MDTVDLVKEKIDIADLIGEYVRLTQAGKNFKGLCPFHQEKSPSFVVSPDRQMWHCFGCAKGGDVISFLMQYENIEFIEALKILADKAGVNMQLKGTQDQKKFNILFDINSLAARYYHASLKSENAKKHYEYAKSRGLTDEIIDEFKIGVSSDNKDSLVSFLSKKGFSVQDIERAGLAVKSQYGTYRDRFRQRLMFPLFDHFGKIIGFTGRILPEAEHRKELGKYINSPETPIFNKSKVLFGFFKSKDAIRESETAVLVEGQMDYLMLYKAGIKNSVASSGTAFTADQLSIIHKRANSLIVAFDNDKAGLLATERVIDDALRQDFKVKVVDMASQTAKDPGELAQNDPEKMKKLIEEALPAIDFYFKLYKVAENIPIQEKRDRVRKALQRIKSIKSSIERDHYLGKLSSIAGIAQGILAQEMELVKDDNQQLKTPTQAPGAVKVKTAHDALLNRLITLSILHGRAKKLVKENFDKLPTEYQDIFNYLHKEEGAKPLDAESEEFAHNLQLQSSLEPIDEDKIDEELSRIFSRLTGLKLQTSLKELKQRVQKAEQSGDEEGLNSALEELKKVQK